MGQKQQCHKKINEEQNQQYYKKYNKTTKTDKTTKIKADLSKLRKNTKR